MQKQTRLNFKLEFFGITGSERDLDDVVPGQEDATERRLSTRVVVIGIEVVDVVAFHHEITTMPRLDNAALLPQPTASYTFLQKNRQQQPLIL